MREKKKELLTDCFFVLFSRIGINQDERLCSVRSAIATFVIIAIILIAAGVAVGVIFASIKTGNSSGSGSTSVQNPCMNICCLINLSYKYLKKKP